MIYLLKNIRKRNIIYFIFVICFVILQVWLELTLPEYTKALTGAINSNTATMDVVWKNGGMMLLCAGGSMISALACGFCCAKVAADFAKTLREMLFHKVNHFSTADINKFSVPSLITRTTNDVVQLQMFVAMGTQMAIKAPIMAIWALTKISKTSVAWTVSTGVCIAIIVVTVLLVFLLCFPKFKKIQKLTDDLNDATRENVSGVRVIRAFNAEQFQNKKFDEVNSNVTNTNLFTSRIMGLMTPIMTICMNGLTLAIYWIGSNLINNSVDDNIFVQIENRLDIYSNMVVFSSYALQVVMSFMMLIMIFILMPRVLVSANRIKEVLKTEILIKDGNMDIATNEKGHIEFKNVSFSYSDGENVAVSDISFEAKPGQTIAFIGATGSGKTTIMNLLNRFYEATSGEILLNGINIKDYKLEDLRDRISIASQKAILFKGDIKSNITYGCDEQIDDNDPRLEKAIRISKADFVYDLKDGIHSEVSQGGTNFSGGKKQRLSIARAVFKKSEVVVFDDTFSALDYKTDMLVRKAVSEELKDSTIIIVAQRIGTIKNAQAIVLLDDGKISDIGTHEELLKRSKLYQDIALSQLSKEEL